MLELAALVARCYRDGVRSAAGAGWALEDIARGHNGIVFRACSSSDDLAAKVSQVDERGRAAREGAALELLKGIGVAPRLAGLVHEPEDIRVDVLLTGWCNGKPIDEAPPPGAAAWDTIAQAYARVHSTEPVGAKPTVLGVDPLQVVDDMRRRAERLDSSPAELIAAAERVARAVSAPAPRSLVHCDASPRNFLVDGRGVTIVDWENSGWGDPCFDVANIVVTPQLAEYGLSEWDGLFAEHAELLGDCLLAERTRAHARVMSAWWVVRLRQELAAPPARLEGVERPQNLEKLADVCEHRAAELFSL